MKKNCLFCKKEFFKRASHSKKYWATAKFCSKKCANSDESHKRCGSKNHLWKGGWESQRPKCLDCGAILCRKGYKRCHPCSAKYRSGENHSMWKGGDNRLPNCKSCGKKTSYITNTYCRPCYIEIMKSHTGENHPRWVGKEKKLENKRHNQAQYKRKKRGAEGKFSVKDWNDLKKKYGYMCLCCKRCEPLISLEADHIIPISKGGSNYIENIQPLCRSCNARKSAKTINYIEDFQPIKICHF